MAEENKTHRTSAGTDAQDKFESGKTHARKAAEDLRGAAGALAEEYRGKAEEAETEQYVRENPTKAVFTALGIGFVLGLIFRR